MKIYHFLKVLNEQLIEGRKEKDKLLTFHSTKKAAKLGTIVPRTIHVFKSLCVLGITECHMSHQSIELLSETYGLLKDSLTELDLTYSYCGPYGIKVIFST
jgi:hypothetical protein